MQQAPEGPWGAADREGLQRPFRWKQFMKRTEGYLQRQSHKRMGHKEKVGWRAQTKLSYSPYIPVPSSRITNLIIFKALFLPFTFPIVLLHSPLSFLPGDMEVMFVVAVMVFVSLNHNCGCVVLSGYGAGFCLLVCFVLVWFVWAVLTWYIQAGTSQKTLTTYSSSKKPKGGLPFSKKDWGGT